MVVIHDSVCITIIVFQFQYGAIDGPFSITDNLINVQFQFQYGAIDGSAKANDLANFAEFQFQYGAIDGPT